ncbi:TolC family protein [Bacilliculturomica massiliensis]|uniref:TolC family protein n=1 Tax=Bacilliculturomica massiliensis TaxID=1917867 RepID=UPI0013EF5BAC|nr:TolC family protein [Bacilliculturomica massiliensis]
MKKRAFSAALAAFIILTSTPFAFADSGANTQADSTADAAGAPIRLSLKEAVQIMQTTGTAAETAEINRQSDKAIAEGYSETVNTIKKTLDGLDALSSAAKMYSQLPQPEAAAMVAKLNAAYWSGSAEAQSGGATQVNRKITELRRDFAKEHVDSNYQAEMNQIEYNTVQVYYGVLLARDNLKIAQDNLKAQQDILKDTQAQFNVGMVAKKDVLSAQASLETAKSDLAAAETKLENAKMGFNYLLGYPVKQEVVFTDELTEVSGPAITVDEAVRSAQENRNEISGANFARDVHGILLDSLTYQYPSNSSTYLNQKVTYMNAEKTAKDAPSQIEIDIRNRSSELDDLKAAVQSARATREYAEEGYRLTRLSYEAGMGTLSEVQAMQVTAYRASLGVAAAVTNYDLAVYDYNYAVSVGTTRLPL